VPAKLLGDRVYQGDRHAEEQDGAEDGLEPRQRLGFADAAHDPEEYEQRQDAIHEDKAQQVAETAPNSRARCLSLGFHAGKTTTRLLARLAAPPRCGSASSAAPPAP